jgi:uncharacterized protein (TIGR02246 family)
VAKKKPKSRKKPDESPCVDDGSVFAAFEEWLDCVRSQDPNAVAELYDEPTFFFGTLSPSLRIMQEDVLAYFEHFLDKDSIDVAYANEPAVRILGANCDVAQIAGHYIFFFETDGKATSVTARFTFVYRKVDDGWLIVEHHSSMMPS